MAMRTRLNTQSVTEAWHTAWDDACAWRWSDAREPSVPCAAKSAKLALFGLAWRSCGSILNPLYHAAPWRNSVRSAHVYRRRVSVDAGRPGGWVLSLCGAPRASIPYDHCITNSLNLIRPPTSRTQ